MFNNDGKNADRYCNFYHRLRNIAGLPSTLIARPILPLRELPHRDDPRRARSLELAESVQRQLNENILAFPAKSKDEIPYKLRRFVLPKTKGHLTSEPARIPNVRDPRRVKACERASYPSWSIGPPTLVENDLVPAEEETCPVLVVDVSSWPVSKSSCIELWPHECNVRRSQLDPLQLDDAGGIDPNDDFYLQANLAPPDSLDAPIELVEENRLGYDANDDRPMLGAENDEILVDLVGRNIENRGCELKLHEFCDDPDATLVTVVKEEPQSRSRPVPRMDEEAIDIVDLCDSDEEEAGRALLPKPEPLDNEIKTERLREELEIVTLDSDDDDEDVVFCCPETTAPSDNVTASNCKSVSAAASSEIPAVYCPQEAPTGAHVTECSETRQNDQAKENTAAEPPSARTESESTEWVVSASEAEISDLCQEKSPEQMAEDQHMAETLEISRRLAWNNKEVEQQKKSKSAINAYSSSVSEAAYWETATGDGHDQIIPDEGLFFIDTQGACTEELYGPMQVENLITESPTPKTCSNETPRDEDLTSMNATVSHTEILDCVTKTSVCEAPVSLSASRISDERNSRSADVRPYNEPQCDAAINKGQSVDDENALGNNKVVASYHEGQNELRALITSKSRKRQWFSDVEYSASAFITMKFKRRRQNLPEENQTPCNHLEQAARQPEMELGNELLRQLCLWRLGEQYVRNFEFSRACFRYFLNNYKHVPLNELFRVSEQVVQNETWRNRNKHWNTKKNISIEDVTGTEICDLGKRINGKSSILFPSYKNQNSQQKVDQLNEENYIQNLRLSKPVIESTISRIPQSLKENSTCVIEDEMDIGQSSCYPAITKANRNKLNESNGDKFKKRHFLPTPINRQNYDCISSDLKLTIKRDYLNQNHWISSKSKVMGNCDIENKIPETYTYNDKKVPELEINDFEKTPTCVNKRKFVSGLSPFLKNRLKESPANINLDRVIYLDGRYSNPSKRVRLSNKEVQENINININLDIRSSSENNKESIELRKSSNDEKPKTHSSILSYNTSKNYLSYTRRNNYCSRASCDITLTSNTIPPKVFAKSLDRQNILNLSDQCCTSAIGRSIDPVDDDSFNNDSDSRLSIVVPETVTDSELQSDSDTYIDYNLNAKRKVKKKFKVLFGDSDVSDVEEFIHKKFISISDKNNPEVCDNYFQSKKLENSFDIKSRDLKNKSCKDISSNVDVEICTTDDHNSKEIEENQSNYNQKSIEKNHLLAEENEPYEIQNSELEKFEKNIANNVHNDESEKCERNTINTVQNVSIKNIEMYKYEKNIMEIFTTNAEINSTDKNDETSFLGDLESSLDESFDKIISNDLENASNSNKFNKSKDPITNAEVEQKNTTKVILEYSTNQSKSKEICTSSDTITTNSINSQEESTSKEYDTQEDQSTVNSPDCGISDLATMGSLVNEAQMLLDCVDMNHHLESGDFEFADSIHNKDSDSLENDDYEWNSNYDSDDESNNLDEYPKNIENEHFASSISYENNYKALEFENNNDAFKIDSPGNDYANDSDDEVIFVKTVTINSTVDNTSIIKLENSKISDTVIDFNIKRSSNHSNIAELNELQNKTEDNDMIEIKNNTEISPFKNSLNANCIQSNNSTNISVSVDDSTDKAVNDFSLQINTTLSNTIISQKSPSDCSVQSDFITRDSSSPALVIDESCNNPDNSLGNSSTPDETNSVSTSVSTENENSQSKIGKQLNSYDNNQGLGCRTTVDDEALTSLWSKRNANNDLNDPSVLKEFNLAKEILAPEEVKGEISTETQNNDEQVALASLENLFSDIMNEENDCLSKVPSPAITTESSVPLETNNELAARNFSPNLNDSAISTEIQSCNLFKDLNLVIVHEYDKINNSGMNQINDSTLNEKCHTSSSEESSVIENYINNSLKNKTKNIVENDTTNPAGIERRNTIVNKINDTTGNETRNIVENNINNTVQNETSNIRSSGTSNLPVQNTVNKNTFSGLRVRNLNELLAKPATKNSESITKRIPLKNISTSTSSSIPNILLAENSHSQQTQQYNNSNIERNYIIQQSQSLFNTAISTSSSNMRSTNISIVSQNNQPVPGNKPEFPKSSNDISNLGTKVILASSICSNIFADNNTQTTSNQLTVYNLSSSSGYVKIPEPLTIRSKDSQHIINQKIFTYKTLLLYEVYENLKSLGQINMETMRQHADTIKNFKTLTDETWRVEWMIITIVQCIFIFEIFTTDHLNLVLAIQNSVDNLKKQLKEENLNFHSIYDILQIFMSFSSVIPSSTLRFQPIHKKLEDCKRQTDGDQIMTDVQKKTYQKQVNQFKIICEKQSQLYNLLLSRNHHNQCITINNLNNMISQKNVITNGTSRRQIMNSLQQLPSENMGVTATLNVSNTSNQTSSKK